MAKSLLLAASGIISQITTRIQIPSPMIQKQIRSVSMGLSSTLNKMPHQQKGLHDKAIKMKEKKCFS
jgi:hypothetical protein